MCRINIFKVFFLTIYLLCLIVPYTSFTQTAGRITGVIIDKKTGEPLSGANVILVGTTYGAAADNNGEFLILNVPAGSYTVIATYMGYADVFLENVTVNIGLSTKLKVELVSQAIQAEPITILAEKPLIQKSATNATRIITSDEIENLPVRGVAMVAGLQPGLIIQDRNLHIRGGRNDEIATYIDGAQVRSVYSGQKIGIVIPEALEELQIQAGGYEAAFGDANSGIVAMVMREGTPNYSFSIRTETDNFTGMNKKFLGTYSYGYSDHTITASGPIPFLGKKFRFFAAGENRFIRDWYQRFWEPFELVHGETVLEDGSVLQLVDSGARGGMPGETVDAIVWKGGAIPSGASANQYTYNTVISADFKNIKFRFSALGSFNRVEYNSMPIMRIFNTDRIPVTEGSDGTFVGKITHIISPRTYYEISVSYHDERVKSYDPVMKEDYWAYSDSVRNAESGFTFYNYTIDPLDYDFYGFQFERRGALVSGYSHWKRNYIGSKFDFTSQLGRHTFQFGGEFRYWTLKAFSGFTSGGELGYLRANPDLVNDEDKFKNWLRAQGRNTYGYDLLGNETDEGLDPIDKARHPDVGAVYIQDKYEWNDLVLNIGLRLDSYWMDQWEPKEYTDPKIDETENRVSEKDWQRIKGSINVSPRLGFGLPVTDRTVFHFQWGRFIQMPQMSQVYWSQSYLSYTLKGGFYIASPIAFAVRPERTTQYEVGFSQMIGTSASFDATLFYKDIKDQLQARRIFTSPEAVLSSYNITRNGDFATTKGIEFRLTLRRSRRLQGWINYTYSDAKGTGSYLNQASASLDQGTNQISIITPLYFGQKHRGSVNMDYRFDKEDGGVVFERMGINMMFNFNSGHPYTLSTGGLGQNDASQGATLSDMDARDRRPLEPVGASTTPWNFTIDARLDKTISAGRFDFNFYIYVQNLLNTKNVINVFPRTGTDNDGFLNDPNLSGKIVETSGEGYKKLYQVINDRNRQHYLWDYTFRGDDLWSTPRQIRAGVKIVFR